LILREKQKRNQYCISKLSEASSFILKKIKHFIYSLFSLAITEKKLINFKCSGNLCLEKIEYQFNSRRINYWIDFKRKTKT